MGHNMLLEELAEVHFEVLDYACIKSLQAGCSVCRQKLDHYIAHFNIFAGMAPAIVHKEKDPSYEASF